jgi:hypothetical protein
LITLSEEISMSIDPFFKSMSVASARRRRRSPASRLRLEALEDRCLLSFSPGHSYPVGANPQAVATADFNKDGRLDLAVANFGDNTVSVLLGNADGTFKSALASATVASPVSLVVGDFNTDGKPDLAAVNASGYFPSVLLGNGNGTFGAPRFVDTYGSPSAVAVGDFNRDGKPDLAATGRGGVFVVLGKGDGSFQAPWFTFLGTTMTTTSLVAGDLNADGKLDLAMSGYAVWGVESPYPGGSYGGIGAGAGVVLGNGDGTFAVPESGFVSLYNGYTGTSSALADFNRDGKLDLALANAYGYDPSVLLSNGDGSLGAPVFVATGVGASALTAGDSNGDGNIDLLTTNSITGTVSVLLGSGAGAFKPPVNAAVGSSPTGVAVGDFNGDGRMDAAATCGASNNVWVLLNNGNWPTLGAPSISVNDVTIAEGNTGTKNATFTVSLSAASSQTVSVHYATLDGIATTAGGDYQAVSGTLTFAPGVTSRPVTVLVNGDRVSEINESFVLLLTDPSNAFVADMRGVGNIVDDEPHASIDYGRVYVTEGNSGTTSAVFTVRLAAAYDAPVNVNFSTAEGDTLWWYNSWYGPPPAATAGSDFLAVNGTLTFLPGQTLKTISIPVYGDRLGELDEYFSVDLTGSASASIDWAHAVGVIVDNEPRVSGVSANVAEGNTGTKSMTLAVALSAAYDQPVTVSYATSDSTATAGSDYQATSGTLTFAPGETRKFFTVLVYGDRLAEYDESFAVNLTGPTGLLIEQSAFGGGILDDEPRLTVHGAGITEGNSGTQLLTFTVTLAAAYDQAVTVHFATEDGDATVADNDYVATSGTLTFAAGETSKSFTVRIKGDTKKETTESFFVLLSDASSNAFIDTGAAVGQIINDDVARKKK